MLTHREVRDLRLIVPMFLISITTLRAQSPTVIDVNEPRPLSRALDEMERVVQVRINYEDPPYENMADLQDVATAQERLAKPGFQQIVPRDGHVTATVSPVSTGASRMGDAIYDVNLLLANYRQNHLAGDFKVEQVNGIIYVTPTKVLGANGVIRDVTSPMTALVTVPYGRRNVAESAQAIFDEVFRVTGQRIAIGNFPFFPTDMVSFGATQEPARDAFARLLAQAATISSSYRLTFDPKPDKMRIFDYMVNVQQTGYLAPKTKQ